MPGVLRLILPLCAALLLVGCPEEVSSEKDTTPPVTTASVVYPNGGRVNVSPGDSVQVNTPEVEVRLRLNETGTVTYTTDGAEPDESTPGVGMAEVEARITLTETTTVRWLSRDRSGNEELPKQITVVFDEDPPVLMIEPPPGDYAGRLTVRVTANEPAVLYYTTDGSVPVRGGMSTDAATLPADIDLMLPVELRLLAIDTAGNRREAGPLDYVIDAEAPTTSAHPGPGRYLAPIDVTLSADDPGASIRYELDGSEPGLDSPIYDGPIRISEDTDLAVRAYDEGLNEERVRTLRYQIGPRPAVQPTIGATPERFPLVGGLRMAAALIEISGPLSGRLDAPSAGADWASWALGRTAIDAVMWQGGLGPHVMNSAPIVTLASSGDGAPDDNGNGTNADETWYVRVEALAEHVGEAVIPDSLHPPSVLVADADAGLVTAPLDGELDALGLPLWVDDYARMRWAGVPADGRQTGPAALGAALDALAARAETALAADHPVGEGTYAEAVAPIVGLRCVSCHGAGVEPTISTAADLDALGLLAGAPPRLIDLLAADEPHPGDPATPAQVEVVAQWIADGAEAPADAERRPGPSPREGLLALLAVDHAGLMLGEAMAELTYDIERDRLSAFDGGRAQYLIGQATAQSAASPTGTPGLGQVTISHRRFETGPQARLLGALARWVALGEARADVLDALFDGGLAGGDAAPPTPAAARAYAGSIVEQLLSLTLGERGALVESWEPGSGAEPRVDAIALADASVALRRAGAALGDPDAAAAGEAAVMFLIDEMRLADGDYTAGWQAGIQLVSPRRAEVQWAVFAALADAAAAGDSEAAAARDALWGRLEAMWYDPNAGVWQTTLGAEIYSYDPALVARVIDGVGRAVEADLPQARSRLGSTLARLVRPFAWADTWLSGENVPGRDADSDTLPKPQDALPGGVAPVFRRQIDL